MNLCFQPKAFRSNEVLFGLFSYTLSSELDALADLGNNAVDLANNRDERHELRTALFTNSPEVHGLLDLWDGEFLVDSGNKALSAEIVGGVPRDVECPVHSPAHHAAVVTPPDEAAAAEEEHPAVDHEAENLKEDALEPAPNGERQVYKVDDPDEKASAEGAVPAEKQPEGEIKQVIKQGNCEENRPPREGDDQHDVHVPNPGKELNGDDDPPWETGGFLLIAGFRNQLLSFSFFVAVAIDLLPVKFDLADLEPVLCSALGAHDFARGVFVVDPFLADGVRRVIA